MDNITILQGHVLEQLMTLPDESVHCIVTSPPYFGLRNYDLPPQIWTTVEYMPLAGFPDRLFFPGNPACDHVWEISTVTMDGHRNKDWDTDRGNAWTGGKPNGGHKPSEIAPGPQQSVSSDTCALCGAWRGHLGNEPTPEMYTAHLVQIFRECRRVLRSDGIFWLNLGDSYASSGRGPTGKNGIAGQTERQGFHTVHKEAPNGLSEGDMLGIPWRIAFALQADGWVLHSDPIWAKATWMPESISGPRWEQHKIKAEGGRIDCPGCEKCLPNDGLVLRNGSWRPTKAHEYVFMFTKTSRYFGDGLAVRQKAAESSLIRISQKNFANQTGGDKDYGKDGAVRNSARAALENFAANPGHNLTTIWKLKPGMFEGKHFAVFPPSLPDTCVKASVSEGGVCSICGKPYLRVISAAPFEPKKGSNQGNMGKHNSKALDQDAQSPMYCIQLNMNETRKAGGAHDNPFPVKQTRGFKASCACEGSKPVPATVLDPFSGAGTTLLVAARLGLRGIGIELNPSYIELAWKRLTAPRKKKIRPVKLSDGTHAGQLSLLNTGEK